jgi:E3 ubiquitin-protein ligase MARCH6
MHDIYAYGLGLYTLIATILATEFTAEKTSLLLRQDPQTFHSMLRTGVLLFSKWIYLGILGGIVLPLLCGACFDLYIMMPFKRLLSPGTKLEMQIMQNWALGVIHLKIIGRIILYIDGNYARALRNVPPSSPTRNIDLDFP